MRIPVDGGPVTALSSAGYRVAVDAVAIFVGEGATLNIVPRSGAPITQLSASILGATLPSNVYGELSLVGGLRTSRIPRPGRSSASLRSPDGGPAQTPRASGAQSTLCCWSWNRTGSRSAIIHSASAVGESSPCTVENSSPAGPRSSPCSAMHPFAQS